MKKQASLAVVVAACAALFAAPALAQGKPGGDSMHGMPMKSMSHHATKKPMRMAKAERMKRTCMDYAWQSRDAKDCEAGKMKPPHWH
jgi:hypothetical protein